MRFLLRFSFVLALVIATASQARADFSDVPLSHPGYSAVKYLSGAGIINGYEDGTFQPQKPVNRVEALKTILGSAGVDNSSHVATTGFPDVAIDAWFAAYVVKAQERGIVKGNADGTFTPGRQVIRAEFLKMLLETHGFVAEKWTDKDLYADVAPDAWFAPYMNYAGASGLLVPDSGNNLHPGQALTRGEVARVLYLMDILRKGSDDQFLLNIAEGELITIDHFVKANNIAAAKRASDLAVDATQQALANNPEDKVVLGAAKIARAYDFIVNAFIAALSGKLDASIEIANMAITKATEAWEANNETQPIAKHVKDRAREIIAQIEKLKAQQ